MVNWGVDLFLFLSYLLGFFVKMLYFLNFLFLFGIICLDIGKLFNFFLFFICNFGIVFICLIFFKLNEFLGDFWLFILGFFFLNDFLSMFLKFLVFFFLFLFFGIFLLIDNLGVVIVGLEFFF